MSRAADLAERVVQHATRTADTVRQDSEMYMTVQTTVYFMDEYNDGAHGGQDNTNFVLAFRLGRTHNNAIIAALCGRAEGAMDGEQHVVFDPTSQAAQLLMARSILQHVCSTMPDAPLDCNPDVDTVAFYCRLVQDPNSPDSLSDLSWGQRLGGLRVTHATDWDKRMERLTQALLAIMDAMIGTFNSMRPGVHFGVAQQPAT